MQAVKASFLRLAGRQQALIEVLDDRVEAAGNHRSHVKGCAHLGSASQYGAFAPQGTAIPVEGSNAQQGQFQTARGLQHQGCGIELLHPGNQCRDACFVVGDR